MRKNKLIICSCITIFLVIFLSLVFKRDTTLKENIILKDSIIATLNTSNEIDFSKLYSNDWDKLFILPPYSNINDILNTFKLSRKTEVHSNIENFPDINLLLFVESNEIVSYVELPRYMGFLDLSLPIELCKENTKFKIDYNTIIY